MYTLYAVLNCNDKHEHDQVCCEAPYRFQQGAILAEDVHDGAVWEESVPSLSLQTPSGSKKQIL